MGEKRLTWDAGNVFDALMRSVNFAYDLERKNEGKDIPYDGPDITSVRLSAGFNCVTTLTTDELEHARERGREAMREILGCAFRLGIEQGFRILCDDRHLRRIEVRDIRKALDLMERPESSGDLEADQRWRDMVLRDAKDALHRLEQHVEDPGKMFMRENEGG